jgi:hypothetical protein
MIRRFNRFELKYRITARERDAILPVILAHMRPDREGDPSGVYRVTSLYYDTVDLPSCSSTCTRRSRRRQHWLR